MEIEEHCSELLGIPLYFADVCFEPGRYVYADSDDIVLSSSRLKPA